MAVGKGSKIGQAFVSLYADDSALKRGFSSAQKHMQKFAGGIRRVGSAFTTAGTVVGGVAGSIAAPIIGSVVKFASAGDQIHKMSSRVGVSAESLSELKFALEQNGSGLEEFEKSIKGMSNVMLDAERGLSTATDTMDELGLSLDDLAGMSQEERFNTFVSAIGNIEDPARQAAVAMDVFGRAGMNMLPFIQTGADGIEGLRQQARDLGMVMDGESSQAAADLTDLFNRMTTSMAGIAMQIATSVAPAIIAIGDAITPVIVAVSQWIQKNHETVAVIAGVVGAGAVLAGGLLATGLAFGVVSMAVGGLATALGILGTVMGVVLSPIGLVVLAVTAVGAVILGVIGVLTGTFDDWFSWIAEKIKTVGKAFSLLMKGDIKGAAAMFGFNVESQRGPTTDNTNTAAAQRFEDMLGTSLDAQVAEQETTNKLLEDIKKGKVQPVDAPKDTKTVNKLKHFFDPEAEENNRGEIVLIDANPYDEMEILQAGLNEETGAMRTAGLGSFDSRAFSGQSSIVAVDNKDKEDREQARELVNNTKKAAELLTMVHRELILEHA